MDAPATPSALSDRRYARIVLACVAAAFVALIGAALLAVWAVRRTEEHSRWAEHSYTVEQQVASLRLLIERAETARRGYLLNPEPRFRQTFAVAAAAEPRTIATIRRVTADNPRQRFMIDHVETVAAMHIRLLARSFVQARRPGANARAIFLADTGRQLTRDLRRMTDLMVAEERRLLDQRTAAQAESARLLYATLVLCGVLLVAVAVLSISVIRRYTGALIASRDATARLNAELEERVLDRTRDLSRANEEIQRFAYIVSHDLRSPLVNIMGFTGELAASMPPIDALLAAAEREAPAIVTADARMAVREDLPESVRFIRASTQKMDRLINAILRLSREGKRMLAPAPLDPADVADTIVESLRHRLDEQGAEIGIVRPMPTLVADRLAVEQILSNLIENAVKYLKPGRPGRITVSARETAGARIEIDVADNGRGIDPRDHARIFDLFRRSGVQDQPGEGIGLAHVRALAYRLGGLVSCRSAPDEGATFTLSLPATPFVAVDAAAPDTLQPSNA